MRKHRTGTREEWLAARLKLLKAEKELMRLSDEVARQRQQLPWVRIDKDYRFETDKGNASLADLFQGRSQLLVYHFMFGYGFRLTDERRGCTGCSLIADHYARGTEALMGTCQFLDLAPWGRNEEGFEFPQAWWRRHDEYGTE